MSSDKVKRLRHRRQGSARYSQSWRGRADLHRAKIARRLVDYGSLGPPKRVRPTLFAAQPYAVPPFGYQPGVLAGTERAGMIGSARKDIVGKRTTSPLQPCQQACSASAINSNCTGLPVFAWTTIARVRTWPPRTISPIVIFTTLQPRSLLSIAKSNNARSRSHWCWSRRSEWLRPVAG